ncbi:hypothetical protein ACFXTN_025392 [Malus domestica]
MIAVSQLLLIDVFNENLVLGSGWLTGFSRGLPGSHMGFGIRIHGRDELATEPRTATGADGLLCYGDLNVGVLVELIGVGEPGEASIDYDDAGVSVGDHVSHVAPGHLIGNDGFLNEVKLEGT